MNGYTNGHSANGGPGLYEMEDQQMFLFTSESVGEGHPGKYQLRANHSFLTLCNLVRQSKESGLKMLYENKSWIAAAVETQCFPCLF